MGDSDRLTPAGERIHLRSASSLPVGFRLGSLPVPPRLEGAPPPPPPLGPLAAFVGNWIGTGFNIIFRPNSPVTPTVLPRPVEPPPDPNDNILELNLTADSLSFSPSLGSVPNRAMLQNQADVFLNGVPYLQAITDVTTGVPVGIHLEPGLWMFAGPTQNPEEGQTVVRMASIPHGTTVLAQGTATSSREPLDIPAVSITPFVTGNPASKKPFPSQTASNQETPRIPQDLAPFIAAGTITQAILDDPNTVLRNQNSGLEITATSAIAISTDPSSPLFGGGADNIAFLLGSASTLRDPDNPVQNAQTLQMTATFWIETVQHSILVPVSRPGEPPMTLAPETKFPGQLVPAFSVAPPIPITEPRAIAVTSTQIQYSQEVMLNFNTLTWPHVSVATLVPAEALPVPSSAWT